jgi:hypothetical protein
MTETSCPRRSVGLPGTKVKCAHGNTLADEELDLIAASGGIRDPPARRAVA